MTSKKERAAWTEVLQLLGEFTYLYDKQNKLYFNREKRQQGYDHLLEVYNEMTGEERKMPAFKKKLENMRSTFLKELRKVNASKRAGSGPEDIYQPTLWYYSLFDFLEDVAELAEPSQADIFDENSKLVELQEKPKPKLVKREYTIEEPESPESTTQTLKKQRFILQTNTEELIDTGHTPGPQREEDWEIIGKAIGVQMKNMVEQQHVIALKIISDAIFYGKMGKLTENSHITLQSEDSL